jgi:uncharacterized protein YecE (DUF72 family)
VDAAHCTTRLRVGCALWAHRPWVGRFTSGHGSELADYATWCNAVEGNTTFYATPSAATVTRWADQAPTDFRFAFKVPRTVTHDQRLRPSAHRDVATFLRAIEPLGERVGPVQLQLPPSFGPEMLTQLRTFVTGLPTSYRWVVELRHRDFFAGGSAHRAVDDALGSAGVGRVVLDTRPLYASPADTDAAIEERSTKPRLPVVTDVMGGEPIVRVIAGNDIDIATKGLAAWLDPVVEWLRAGKRPYVFVHQPDNGHSPELARSFHEMVSVRVPGLVPLPESRTPDPPSGPDQAPLF